MVCGVIENRASVINHPTVDRKRERDKKIELDTAKACPQWETRYCCSPWRGWIGCWDVSCLITFSALPKIFMHLLRVMKPSVHVKMSLSFSHYNVLIHWPSYVTTTTFDIYGYTLISLMTRAQPVYYFLYVNTYSGVTGFVVVDFTNVTVLNYKK